MQSVAVTPTESTTQALGAAKYVCVVLGARGGAGSKMVKSLLENQSVAEVRAIVRDPAKVAKGTLPDDDLRLKVITGDVATSASLKDVFEGATHVLNFTAGRSYEACQAVDCNGVGETAKLAKACGVQRYLLCSSQLVDPGPNSGKFIRLMLNNVITGKFCKKQLGAMDLKHEGEKLLRRSGIEYTIVRPGRLTFGPSRAGNARVGQTNSHFMSGAPTTRSDLADVCVVAALDPACANVTFEMACEKPKKGEAALPPTSSLFDGLDPKWDDAMI